MNAATVIDQLVDTGVLELTESGDSVRRADVLHEVDDTDVELTTLTTNPAVADLIDAYDLGPEVELIQERIGPLSDERLVDVMLLLLDFERPEPPTDGRPAYFTSVHGELLDLLILRAERAIVYVWRRDCDPCDAMRVAFDELFTEPPADIALFAVYGPDAAASLEREWDVAAGPTTLFVRDGGVDSRLVGAKPRSTIEREIDTLRTG
jgi:thiol-disulfide isomerase/thioredoxin